MSVLFYQGNAIVHCDSPACEKCVALTTAILDFLEGEDGGCDSGVAHVRLGPFPPCQRREEAAQTEWPSQEQEVQTPFPQEEMYQERVIYADVRVQTEDRMEPVDMVDVVVVPEQPIIEEEAVELEHLKPADGGQREEVAVVRALIHQAPAEAVVLKKWLQSRLVDLRLVGTHKGLKTSCYANNKIPEGEERSLWVPDYVKIEVACRRQPWYRKVLNYISYWPWDQKAAYRMKQNVPTKTAMLAKVDQDLCYELKLDAAFQTRNNLLLLSMKNKAKSIMARYDRRTITRKEEYEIVMKALAAAALYDPLEVAALDVLKHPWNQSPGFA